MTKFLYLSAGTKGGVGKSTTAIAVADLLSSRGGRLAVVETDVGQPDLMNRFSSSVDVRVGRLSLAGDPEAAVVRLGRWLENQGSEIDSVVINAPAGGGDILDPFSQDIAALSCALGYQFAVGWNIGPSREDADSVGRSLESGGLLAEASARRTVIQAAFLGDPRSWAWRSAPARQAAQAAGVGEAELPRLNQETMNLVVSKNTVSLDDLIGPAAGLYLIDRSRIARWRAACRAMAAGLLGDEGGE